MGLRGSPVRIRASRSAKVRWLQESPGLSVAHQNPESNRGVKGGVGSSRVGDQVGSVQSAPSARRASTAKPRAAPSGRGAQPPGSKARPCGPHSTGEGGGQTRADRSGRHSSQSASIAASRLIARPAQLAISPLHPAHPTRLHPPSQQVCAAAPSAACTPGPPGTHATPPPGRGSGLALRR